MERFEKIATIKNEIEALCLRAELQERRVPLVLQCAFSPVLAALY